MEHREETGGVIIQVMPLPSATNLAYSAKTSWLVSRVNPPHQVQLPNPSIEKFHQFTGLAALPLIPYRRSIDTKHSQFICMQDGTSTPHWHKCSWSIPKSGYLRFHCRNDYCMPQSYHMHLIAVNQLVYVHLKCMFPTFLVRWLRFKSRVLIS